MFYTFQEDSEPLSSNERSMFFIPVSSLLKSDHPQTLPIAAKLVVKVTILINPRANGVTAKLAICHFNLVLVGSFSMLQKKKKWTFINLERNTLSFTLFLTMKKKIGLINLPFKENSSPSPGVTTPPSWRMQLHPYTGKVDSDTDIIILYLYTSFLQSTMVPNIFTSF